MTSNVSQGVGQVGKLYVRIAENGHSFELDCDEYTLVQTVQRFLESVTGIRVNDQLLLCSAMKLETKRPLSAYKLPSNDREVFLFNKSRMRSNSPPPVPEQVEIINIPDPPSPSSSSHDPHPLDDATDPALKALASYERHFRYHFQLGHVIYSRTLAKYEICDRFFSEQKVQERALEIARGNLNNFYSMINQNYKDFMKYYLQQHRSHSNLLMNFGRYIEKLRSHPLLPALQATNRKCLLDFVKEANLQKLVRDFSSSHKQFENKVTEFKEEFRELERNAEHLSSSKASFLVKELDLTITNHQRYINEQKSILQALSKDVNMVKELVDDCLNSQLSSSLRPHDAVSALGPMYDGHDKSYLPKMQTCERAISDSLDYCRDKKNEMNIFVHNYMQKMAYIQYTIKDVRYKFSVFQEALKHQSDQFEQLKVVPGVGPSYRACLAEVARRKATMKLFMGMAGQLAERLAAKREIEVRTREQFLKLHGSYIPRDILESMGLYDMPSQCDVNIAPFDTNLLDIDISDIDRYAPEIILAHSTKSEKQGSLKGSNSMSNDSSQMTEIEENALDFEEKFDSEVSLEGSELVEIAGTSKIEIENARLRAELASKIALICSIPPEFDNESGDDTKINSLMKQASERTAEALRLKEEYEKHLHYMLKMKQMKCESYEKRIQELEQRLSDQYQQGQKNSIDEDVSNVTLSMKSDDSKSEILDVGGDQMQHGSHEAMDEISGSSSSRLDSSMLDSNCDEGNLCYKDGKETVSADGEVALATSSMVVSISQSPDASFSETTLEPGSDPIVLQLQSELIEKSNQLNEAENKLKALTEEITRLGGELERSQKLLDESQMNYAHLENCLHEAREEAQTHLCAADRRASQYRALRASAVKMRSLFERLRHCVSSGAVAGLAESLRALAQSLATSIKENEEDGAAEFRECMMILAEKVGFLSRHRAELLDKYTKSETANDQLVKELEERKEFVNTLHKKRQLEKQANKEKISFGRLEVHEVAAFVLNSAGHYEAINRNSPHYYLSSESVALFADHLPNRPSYIIGEIVHIERQIVRSPSLQGEHSLTSAAETSLVTVNPGSSSNPYHLPAGCVYYLVTVAMLPDTTHSPAPS